MGHSEKQSLPSDELSNSKCVSKHLLCFERHFTVDEVATMWKLSKDSVRRLFRNEAGVLSLSLRQRKGKRHYATLRIPQSVLERVHKRCSLVGC